MAFDPKVLKKLKEPLAGAFTATLGFAGVLATLHQLDLWKPQDSRTYFWLLGAAFVLFFLLAARFSILARLGKPLVFLPHNLILLLFGNRLLHERVRELHEATLALAGSALFKRILRLNPSDETPYYIVYTHKGGAELHGPLPGKDDAYQIGFPYDEAEIIALLWSLVAEARGLLKVRIVCSCNHALADEKRKLLNSAFAIVGSSKGNPFCDDLMKALDASQTIRRNDPYVFKTEWIRSHGVLEEFCYLDRGGGSHPLKPTDIATASANPNVDAVDYALLMKLPNIMAEAGSSGKEILLFAGCKAAGQVGLGEWLSDVRNLSWLATTYPNQDFYLVLEVKYRYRPGRPQIQSTNILYHGPVEQRKI